MHLNLIKRSLESKHPLEIIYLADNGTFSQRVIEVLNINETHLIGYCRSKKARRMFKVANILSASLYQKIKAL